MTMLIWGWNRLEEGLVVLLLTAMTLVTFTYVAVNNLYEVFYSLADTVPALETPAFAVGDWLLTLAQQMTWSLALTTSMFAWLIFIGIAYGVRVGAHIGVDLLTRLFPERLQRVFGVLACLIFIAYAGLLMASSYQWLQSLLVSNVGVEDLDQFGVREWQVALIQPIGFALIIARLIEVMLRILRGEQLSLEQSGEASDALAKLEGGNDADDSQSTQRESHS